jgi:hypothetical protein
MTLNRKKVQMTCKTNQLSDDVALINSGIN